MTKYTPLGDYLRPLPVARVTLTFGEIETILGSRLPASSHSYEAHWRGTTPGRPGGAIAAVGWRVDRIDWHTGSVTLSRATTVQPSAQSVAPTINASARPIEELAPWQTLEAHAAGYFSHLWSTDLMSRSVSVGGVPKAFDLVSADGRFVGDAKQYKNIPTPSAKAQGIAEYVWLLQHVKAEHRFLVLEAMRWLLSASLHAGAHSSHPLSSSPHRQRA